MRSPDPAQWSAPRYHKIHLYQWMNAEGRIITVSSGASSPELYAPHHELYGNQLQTPTWPPQPPSNGALEGELVRSEGRRSALAESLLTAHSAMKHQEMCLQEQDRHMIRTEAWLEQLLFKQEVQSAM
ncbi:hypothetical protein NDU88_007641 [Pleurodeles waltl]|uniref:Uncharacterized protein n=1 Tax=Pleurodeles waltl TaxID=8319 RepID=A0AAV7WHP2_PLEWA|nr:hypothetical protein NDU88_007641 [Pleurodeles waltl]